ncbi:hypothetical protein FD16_GL001973 [Paucilactobacillus suebicus DSM 5007 = KCTC 3549]|uniref:Uncharacterized protein n=1 Tax=Paucilactobacillus suebicus DSM 5007 = KCTC 3549 TaxID=1423807 RepID=A0A0R1WAS6_9LACO|nr:hypothetical protein FD16_GL001973 [Paucilactobacillus suebicus DSM 5007 = KCTC 3549]
MVLEFATPKLTVLVCEAADVSLVADADIDNSSPAADASEESLDVDSETGSELLEALVALIELDPALDALSDVINAADFALTDVVDELSLLMFVAELAVEDPLIDAELAVAALELIRTAELSD